MGVIEENVHWAPGYHVTRDGRLYYKNKKKGWIERKQYQHKNGYLRVSVNRVKFSVHRLVALVYLKKQKHQNVVMHIDNDKLHNHVSNLKWGTQKENIQQMYLEGRQNHSNKYSVRGEKHFNSKITDNTRQEVIKLYNEGFKRREIMKITNVSKGQFRRLTIEQS